MIRINGINCIAVLLALATPLPHAQAQNLTARSSAKPPAVEYLYPGKVTVPAGKPTTVVLHFHIAPGLHINSHTPKEEEFIPTTLSIPDGSGVRLDAAVYPPGAEFELPIDPKTKLSVYTGDFIIQARIVAEAGDHLIQARLRYQACDNNACMPPRTITVPILVNGK
jgi:hypothetical protein